MKRVDWSAVCMRHLFFWVQADSSFCNQDEPWQKAYRNIGSHWLLNLGPKFRTGDVGNEASRTTRRHTSSLRIVRTAKMQLQTDMLSEAPVEGVMV